MSDLFHTHGFGAVAMPSVAEPPTHEAVMENAVRATPDCRPLTKKASESASGVRCRRDVVENWANIAVLHIPGVPVGLGVHIQPHASLSPKELRPCS